MLYLIRHGMPAIADYDNRHPGPGLGELGKAQAIWIAQQLRSLGIAQAFASDFTRVLETMEPFMASQGSLKPTTAIALRERDPKVEPHESLVARVQNWWAENEALILAKNTAIFSHCGPLNRILNILDPEETSFQYPFTSPHGCHTDIAGIWRLERNEGQWSGELIPCPL
jgi:2,3-bisphosphoglycerate-dependent phosphoglycerate mutase